LTLLISSGIAKNSFGFSLSSIMGKGYKKISDAKCQTSGRVTGRSFLVSAPDGGYALTVSTLVDVELTKINAQGNPEWRSVWRKQGEEHAARGLVALRDGGYILVGATSSYEQSIDTWGKSVGLKQNGGARYPLVLRFDGVGKPLPYSIQSEVSDVNGAAIKHVIELSDGLVFLGVKNIDPINKLGTDHGKLKIPVPWIFKVSSNGSLLWEHCLSADEGHLVKDMETVSGSISKPTLDADGNIIFTSQVDIPRVSGSGKYNPFGDGDNPRLLLCKLDGNGRELGRYRNFNCANGIPIFKDSVIHIIAHTAVRGKPGVEHIVLGKEWQVLKSASFTDEDVVPYAVASAPSGAGFHVLGLRISKGAQGAAATLAYLDDHGFKYEKSFGDGLWPGDMASGRDRSSIAITHSSGDEKFGITFHRFDFSD